MTNEIDILDRFLQQFSPEVGARTSEALTSEMEGKLRQLSAGQLPEQEHKEVSRELLTNQNAVDFLLKQLDG
jgi:Holliday junction resolvasome RuvABC DNA-binding subunit